MCSTIEIIRLVSYIILGLMVVGIAYQQWIVAKNKLDLDLYNKRFEVYTDTLSFFQDLATKNPSAEIHRKFIVSKEASYHLFSDNKEIYELLEKMNKESGKVMDFKNLGNEMDGDPKEKHKMAEEHIKTLAWFNQSMPILRNMMSRYLKQ